jgi:hypothetical protein
MYPVTGQAVTEGVRENPFNVPRSDPTLGSQGGRMSVSPVTMSVMPVISWPPWWKWDLEITPHVERRMEDRDFTEVDLRDMMEKAAGFRADFIEGRFVIETDFRGRRWEVIVEPDAVDGLLVVITAYAVETP